MRDGLEIIDADFEVIEPAFADRYPAISDDTLPAGPVEGGRWTFWDDDFPNIAGFAAGLAVLFAFRYFFGR